eukprot:6321020-Amphidinium_carterae.1
MILHMPSRQALPSKITHAHAVQLLSQEAVVEDGQKTTSTSSNFHVRIEVSNLKSRSCSELLGR